MMRFIVLLLFFLSATAAYAQPKQEIPPFLHSEPWDSMVLSEDNTIAVPVYQWQTDPVVTVAPDSITVMVQGEMRAIPIHRGRRGANSTSVLGHTENDRQFYPFGIIPRLEPQFTRLDMEEEFLFPPPNRVPVINGIRGAAYFAPRR